MTFNSFFKNISYINLIILTSMILTGCGGGGGGGASDSASGSPAGNLCGNVASSTYTINWDAVSDSDVTGYRVYYGLTSPISKTNSSFQALGNVNTWVMIPSDYGYTSCSTIYIAVASVGGSKGISSLSAPVSIVVE